MLCQIACSGKFKLEYAIGGSLHDSIKYIVVCLKLHAHAYVHTMGRVVYVERQDRD